MNEFEKERNINKDLERGLEKELKVIVKNNDKLLNQLSNTTRRYLHDCILYLLLGIKYISN